MTTTKQSTLTNSADQKRTLRDRRQEQNEKRFMPVLNYIAEHRCSMAAACKALGAPYASFHAWQAKRKTDTTGPTIVIHEAPAKTRKTHAPRGHVMSPSRCFLFVGTPLEITEVIAGLR